MGLEEEGLFMLKDLPLRVKHEVEILRYILGINREVCHVTNFSKDTIHSFSHLKVHNH